MAKSRWNSQPSALSMGFAEVHLRSAKSGPLLTSITSDRFPFAANVSFLERARKIRHSVRTTFVGRSERGSGKIFTIDAGCNFS